MYEYICTSYYYVRTYVRLLVYIVLVHLSVTTTYVHTVDISLLKYLCVGYNVHIVTITCRYVFLRVFTLPRQLLQIVESTSVPPFDKLSGTSAANPLQFLSTSTIRMIADCEQPVALIQPNGGKKRNLKINVSLRARCTLYTMFEQCAFFPYAADDRSSDPSTAATLSKMAVHTGNNTFTIFSDSLHKAAAAAATVEMATAPTTTNTTNTTKLAAHSTTMQLTQGKSNRRKRKLFVVTR